MRNLNKISAIIILSVIFLAAQAGNQALAHGGSSRGSGNNSVINASSDNSGRGNSNEDRFRIRIDFEDEDEQLEEPRLRIENNNFEARGFVSGITAGSFVVNGQIIQLDPLAGSVDLTAILNDGDFVKAEGRIADGQFLAREIKVQNINQVQIPQPIQVLTIDNQTPPTLQGLVSVLENFLERLRVLADRLQTN